MRTRMGQRVGGTGLVLALATASCGSAFDASPGYEVGARAVWSTELWGAGTSSPRARDVNGDGVLDVLVGAGRESRRGALAALDGATGELLWTRAFGDEVYATPLCLDEPVPQAIVGSRRLERDLAAVALADGSTRWSLAEANPESPLPDLHFNSAVAIPDQDGDGAADVLALQSGADDAAREPARLYFVSSADGRILRRAEAPFGAESYSVPALDRLPDGSLRLILGTGGETLPGFLFCLDFPSLEERWRLPSGDRGFVPSPVLHDFDGDGVRDVVATAFHGVVYRVDGATGEVVWFAASPGFQTYSTPALGRFDDADDVLDVAVLVSKGTWPEYVDRAVLRWLDGATGAVLAERELGTMGSSSPIVADLDGDGFDEVVQVSNRPTESFEQGRKNVPSLLAVYDGRRGKEVVYEREDVGFSSSTPWLGDLDGDGYLDLVHVLWDRVLRLSLHVPVVQSSWNQYRGAGQDGIVRRP